MGKKFGAESGSEKFSGGLGFLIFGLETGDGEVAEFSRRRLRYQIRRGGGSGGLIRAEESGFLEVEVNSVGDFGGCSVKRTEKKGDSLE